VRVQETLEHFIEGYGKRFDIDWERKIYLASSATILDVVRECDDQYNHILVVGHNPGIEDIIFDLVPDDGSEHRDMVEKKYPTGAFSELHLNCEHWTETSAISNIHAAQKYRSKFWPRYYISFRDYDRLRRKSLTQTMGDLSQFTL
jgi:phosphohistidine phosphatase SixA